MEIPGAVSSAAALAKLPFEFGRRVRQGNTILQDLEMLRHYHDTVLNMVELSHPKLGNDHVVEAWIKQLGEAKDLLDRIKPKHRTGIRDRHVVRDTEKLTQARKLICDVKNKLDDTLKIMETSPDTFNDHHYEPDKPKQSFRHCDQVDDVDEEGMMVREGRLRELLLSEGTRSKPTPIFCARGPGGMGKTVALKWLCNDSAVRNRFNNGIHWFSFGADLEDRELMGQIRRCALDCGMRSVSEELKNEASVEVAICKIGACFNNKAILLIVDDVWNSRKEELLLIRRSLGEGSHCAMAISSREVEVATACDEVVTFSFLHSTGGISRDVLLSALDDNKREDVLEWLNQSQECSISFENGMRECGGWVLCLAVAGALLREDIEDCEDVEEAVGTLRTWARSLVDEADLTGGGTPEYPRGLQHIVSQGLEHAKQNLGKRGFPDALSSSVAEKFMRLCVMQKQSAMAVNVLMKVWMLGMKETMRVAKALKEMSLIEVVRVKKVGKVIRVHDKMIELCRDQVGEGEVGKHHEELLETFLGVSTRIHWREDVFYRPWWKLSAVSGEGEYIMENLGHHLAEAGLEKELWGVLCDARFVMQWLKDGRGWIGVSENFDRVVRVGLEANEGLGVLRRALQSSWPLISNARYSLGFELYNRLDKQAGASVCRFLRTIEQFAISPWIQPVQPYLVPSDSREEHCYHLGYETEPMWLSEDFGTVIAYNESRMKLIVFDARQQKALHEVPCGTSHAMSCSRDVTHAVQVLEEDGWLETRLRHIARNETMEDVSEKLRNEVLDVFYRCGEASAIHSPQKFAVVFNDTVTVIRVSTDGSTQHTRLPGHEGRVRCVAFSADGTRVVSGSDDRTVRVWSVSNGRQLSVLSGHEHWVKCVTLSADGTRVASGSDDRTVRVWSVRDGRQLGVLSGHEGWVRCVALSADGTHVASGSDDRTVRVWSVSNGRQLSVLCGHEGWVRCVAFSADGTRVASGSDDQTVRVWSVRDDRQLSVLSGHEHWVRCVAFSADGTRVASGSRDRTVRVWSVSDGRQPSVLCGHEGWVKCVAFSADGTRVASGSDDRTVRVWSVSDGRQLSVLCGHEDWVRCVALSADGTRVASGSDDRTVRVWSVSDGRQASVLSGHEDSVKFIAFSANGTRVASGSYDQTVRVWSVSDGRQLSVLSGHEGAVECVALNADGTRVASGSKDRTVRVWSVSDGRQPSVLCGHEGWVKCVAFSADGARVASGSDDRTVRVWSVSDGRQVSVFSGHEDPVECVALSADGRRMASGWYDDTVQVWKCGEDGHISDGR
ncbi:unnamed protein product [Agarophyton chilense]